MRDQSEPPEPPPCSIPGKRSAMNWRFDGELRGQLLGFWWESVPGFRWPFAVLSNATVLGGLKPYRDEVAVHVLPMWEDAFFDADPRIGDWLLIRVSEDGEWTVRVERWAVGV